MKYQSIIIKTNSKEEQSIKEFINSNVLNGLLNKDFILSIFPNKNNKIGIANVSELAEWSSLKIENGVKTAILYSAESLTADAQNSLLKILEEPTDNTLLVLITNNYDHLLPTIRSRCISFILENGDEEQGDEIYKKVEEFINLDFIARTVIIKELQDRDRSYVINFLEKLLKKTIEENYKPEISNTILEAINGIKKNTNVKLTLDMINLSLS